MIQLPKLSLVVLIGASGSGKSTFARKHFLRTEVLSSDAFRGMVSDDENDQAATRDAFEILHFVAAKRLAAGRLVVVDATNVQPEARAPLVALARAYHVVPVAVVLDLPEKLCQERNRGREDRTFGPHVIRNQASQLRRSMRNLKREGFRHVFELSSPEEVEAAVIERVPLWTDRRHERGPFDIIGDVHGCCDELESLLNQMGYAAADGAFRHPEGRRAVFVGDLVDRGPRSLDTLRLVRAMMGAGTALCVPGNHDMKFLRWLHGKQVQQTHGLDRTVAEIEAMPGTEEERKAYRDDLAKFLDGLISHFVLDDGKLVVAHAGMKAEFQGRASGAVRQFALYGETTGETDEFGLPVRLDWAAEYRGPATVVFGHTPVPEPAWLNRTVNVDTGCVFGGSLTALRYPEMETVSVPAARVYAEPIRPLRPETSGRSAQQEHDDILDADDVLGKRFIATRLHSTVTIREENSAAALEVMSRFAVAPQWLIYLPPTMSPCETSSRPGLLEHPAEAFGFYRSQGVAAVVCEEKHMGSRAVVVVCKDADAARERFGVPTGESGIIYTRTGRRFFNDVALEAALLERLRVAMAAAGVWEEFGTSWACIDAELMPWSAKAQELLRSQYAAVGSAGRASSSAAVLALEKAAARMPSEAATRAMEKMRGTADSLTRYTEAYRAYCWPVAGLDDLKLAPFHLLATEGAAHVDKSHVWHMETLARVCAADAGLLLATRYKSVDLGDPQAEADAFAWWETMTAAGGEGMVVKPRDFIARGKRGTVQPAVKCRGPEYLRLIYGPEYSSPENLERLRRRGLGAKRSLALREFALGVESLERFLRREPLRRVHECVFGVLALESEPVDPRL